MVKTAILVSGGGANLQTILDDMLFGVITNCEIVGVIATKPDVYALTRARNAGVPEYVVDSSIFPNIASFTEAILCKLEDIDAQLVVLAGYEPEVFTTLVRKYENRIINTQPSLLPAFGGTELTGEALQQSVLDAGCRITGATAYFVSKVPHTGPIILQKAIEIPPEDTAASLQRRVMEECEWELLPKAVNLYCSGKLTVTEGRVLISE